MAGSSAVPIVLSEDERAELVRRAGGPGRWRTDRARIVLACAEGMSNAAAAQALGVAVKSVSKWRRQFAAQRLAGLEDAAPVGRPKAELVLEDEERAITHPRSGPGWPAAPVSTSTSPRPARPG
jgi:transposase-like protein